MNELIDCVKENEKWIKGNNALIIAAISFVLTLGTLYVKFVLYAYTIGKLSYWKISAEFVAFNDTSSIMNFIYSFFTFIYIFIPIILGFVWVVKTIRKHKKQEGRDKHRKGKTIIASIAICMLCLIYYGSFIMTAFVKNISSNMWWKVIGIIFVATIILCVIYFILVKRNDSKEKKDIGDIAINIITFGIACILIVFTANTYGYNLAENKTIFDLVEDKAYAVIHSYEDDYLLLACEVDDTTNTIIIDTDTKVVIGKEDLVITTYQFDEVEVSGISHMD